MVNSTNIEFWRPGWTDWRVKRSVSYVQVGCTHFFRTAIGGTGRNQPFLDLRCFAFEVLISITPLSLLNMCKNKQSWETRTVAKYSWRHSHLATEGRTSSGDTAMILWWLITWWMLLHKQIKPYQLEILLPFPYVSNLGKSKVYS